MYLIGGYAPSVGEVSNHVFMFKPGSGVWTGLSSGTSELHDGRGTTAGPCNGATSETCIYEVAGDQAPNATGGFDTTAVEMFNPALAQWSPVRSLPTKTTDLASATGPCLRTTGVCIYAVGGSSARHE